MTEEVWSDYLHSALDTRRLPQTVRHLREHILAGKLKFNAIAFRGMSGALVAPMLATRMRKGLICVRKPDDKSHGFRVEGKLGGPYIILDDFINYGDTIDSIIDTIHKYVAQRNKELVYINRSRVHAEKLIELCMPVGVFLYRCGESRGSHYPKLHTALHTAGIPRIIPVFGCQYSLMPRVKNRKKRKIVRRPVVKRA